MHNLQTQVIALKSTVIGRGQKGGEVSFFSLEQIQPITHYKTALMVPVTTEKAKLCVRMTLGFELGLLGKKTISERDHIDFSHSI